MYSNLFTQTSSVRYLLYFHRKISHSNQNINVFHFGHNTPDSYMIQNFLSVSAAIFFPQDVELIHQSKRRHSLMSLVSYKCGHNQPRLFSHVFCLGVSLVTSQSWVPTQEPPGCIRKGSGFGTDTASLKLLE